MVFFFFSFPRNCPSTFLLFSAGATKQASKRRTEGERGREREGERNHSFMYLHECMDWHGPGKQLTGGSISETSSPLLLLFAGREEFSSSNVNRSSVGANLFRFQLCPLHAETDRSIYVLKLCPRTWCMHTQESTYIQGLLPTTVPPTVGGMYVDSRGLLAHAHSLNSRSPQVCPSARSAIAPQPSLCGGVYVTCVRPERGETAIL